MVFESPSKVFGIIYKRIFYAPPIYKLSYVNQRSYYITNEDGTGDVKSYKPLKLASEKEHNQFFSITEKTE